ncbi:MAG: 5-dehydro-4-deoxy-D-glucuronate isomerase [Acidobacteriota bacterium]
MLKQCDAERVNEEKRMQTASRELRVVPTTDYHRLAGMTTTEIRKFFLVDDLFGPAPVRLVYCEYDRLVVGSVVPSFETISLDDAGGLRTEYFTERRELGVMNVGGPGVVGVEKNSYELGDRDALYIGRGNRHIRFSSGDPDRPAAYYLVSYPAHAAYPVRLIRKRDAEDLRLGDLASSNRRCLHKYIHPGGVQSCQLVMGLTELETGSVWNTMPAHTHERRSEIYLYFDLPKDGLVIHCLGRPQETRHVMVRNRQAVLSPGWSIHAGVGTSNYSFIWAMGGENQEFSDTDPVPMEDLA